MTKRTIRRRKKMKTMDKILICLGIFLFVFTITMIICIYRTGGSYDTLIEKVFQGCLGEGGIMGVIQTAKVLKGESKEDNDDK